MTLSKFDAESGRFSRRELVVASAAFALLAGCSTLPRIQPKTVLFVCEFGTAKSVIAREMFRHRASIRGLEIAAISRGLVIEDHITPELRQRLAADGINPNSEPFQKLTQDDWRNANVVVAFNPLPVAVPHAKIRDWTDVPSVVSQYPAARASLNQKIEALLDDFLMA